MAYNKNYKSDEKIENNGTNYNTNLIRSDDVKCSIKKVITTGIESMI